MSRNKRPPFCVYCGAKRHHHASPYCEPCRKVIEPVRIKNISIIAKERRQGRLPNAKTLVCVDCGAPAFDYDHRDYEQPLLVVPVCRRCNQLRGPAAFAPLGNSAILRTERQAA